MSIHAAEFRATIEARRGPFRAYAIGVVMLGLVFIGRGALEIPPVPDVAAHDVDARLAGFTVVSDGSGRVSRDATVRDTTADGRQIAATTEDQVASSGPKAGEKLRVTWLSTGPRRVRLSETAGTIGFWTWFLLGLGSTVGWAVLAAAPAPSIMSGRAAPPRRRT